MKIGVRKTSFIISKIQRSLRRGVDLDHFGMTLANKESDAHVHDFIGKKLWDFVRENKVSTHLDEYLNAWHFENQ